MSSPAPHDLDTPLMLACRKKDEAAVKELLQGKPDIFLKNRQSETVFDILLQGGIEQDHPLYLLLESYRKGIEEQVRKYIAAGDWTLLNNLLDTYPGLKQARIDGKPLIQLALEAGKPEIAANLIEKQALIPDLSDEQLCRQLIDIRLKKCNTRDEVFNLLNEYRVIPANIPIQHFQAVFEYYMQNKGYHSQEDINNIRALAKQKLRAGSIGDAIPILQEFPTLVDEFSGSDRQAFGDIPQAYFISYICMYYRDHSQLLTPALKKYIEAIAVEQYRKDPYKILDEFPAVLVVLNESIEMPGDTLLIRAAAAGKKAQVDKYIAMGADLGIKLKNRRVNQDYTARQWALNGKHWELANHIGTIELTKALQAYASEHDLVRVQQCLNDLSEVQFLAVILPFYRQQKTQLPPEVSAYIEQLAAVKILQLKNPNDIAAIITQFPNLIKQEQIRKFVVSALKGKLSLIPDADLLPLMRMFPEWINDPVNQGGDTLLIWAAAKGDMALVKACLELGANITAKGSRQLIYRRTFTEITARQIAHRNGHKDIERLLAQLEIEQASKDVDALVTLANEYPEDCNKVINDAVKARRFDFIREFIARDCLFLSELEKLQLLLNDNPPVEPVLNMQLLFRKLWLLDKNISARVESGYEDVASLKKYYHKKVLELLRAHPNADERLRAYQHCKQSKTAMYRSKFDSDLLIPEFERADNLDEVMKLIKQLEARLLPGIRSLSKQTRKAAKDEFVASVKAVVDNSKLTDHEKMQAYEQAAFGKFASYHPGLKDKETSTAARLKAEVSRIRYAIYQKEGRDLSPPPVTVTAEVAVSKEDSKQDVKTPVASEVPKADKKQVVRPVARQDNRLTKAVIPKRREGADVNDIVDWAPSPGLDAISQATTRLIYQASKAKMEQAKEEAKMSSQTTEAEQGVSASSHPITPAHVPGTMFATKESEGEKEEGKGKKKGKREEPPASTIEL